MMNYFFDVTTYPYLFRGLQCFHVVLFVVNVWTWYVLMVMRNQQQKNQVRTHDLTWWFINVYGSSLIHLMDIVCVSLNFRHIYVMSSVMTHYESAIFQVFRAACVNAYLMLYWTSWLKEFLRYVQECYESGVRRRDFVE